MHDALESCYPVSSYKWGLNHWPRVGDDVFMLSLEECRKCTDKDIQSYLLIRNLEISRMKIVRSRGDSKKILMAG